MDRLAKIFFFFRDTGASDRIRAGEPSASRRAGAPVTVTHSLSDERANAGSQEDMCQR